MGIATEIETAIDGLLNTFVATKSAAICAALVPVAITGVTIYIMSWASRSCAARRTTRCTRSCGSSFASA